MSTRGGGPGSRAAFTLTAVLAVVAGPLSAQSPAAAGRVVSAATGERLAGAEVRLLGADTIAVRTNAQGEWSAPALAPGRYVVRVRMLGHLPVEQVAEIVPGWGWMREMRLEPVALALDEVVVTGARREQRLQDAVATTELVSRAEIERSGASDVGSVLTEQTGIQLQGGHPAGAGVMLQGIGSERVLVLLDGQPVAGRISGVFDISRIPTAMVERIEVVKGPQSTLYGTDAMGGVVNVITRTPPAGVLGMSLSALAGSQERRDGSARLTIGRGSLASTFDVSRRSTSTTPGLGSPDGALARRLDGAGKVRWSPDSTRWIEASVLALDERQRWRSGTFYNFSDNVQWSGRLGASLTRGAHSLTPTISASVYDHLSRGSSETKPIAGDPGQRQLQRVFQGELLYNGRLGAAGRHALDLGTVVRQDDMETERVPGGLRSIATVEPFAQLEVAATRDLALLPGVRVSRSSQWGTRVTPRLAARLRATDHFTLRASVGDGFRAPDFKELHMFFVNNSAGYAVRGNPGLRPESSRNASAGAEWAHDRVYLRGQLFWNGFRDFIETRPVSAPDEATVYQYANIDNGTTKGVELESGIVVSGLRLEASYSGLATRDEATGSALLGRPVHSGRAAIGTSLPLRVRANVSAIVTGRTPMQRDAETGAVTQWRDAFTRLDARVARRLPGLFDTMELVVGADNLFDARPARWAGYTGRHLYTALSWSIDNINGFGREDAP